MVTDDVYPGWTSLAVLILVVGGFIMISTGVAGLYIGKIFGQVKGRPLYIIEQCVGAQAAGHAPASARRERHHEVGEGQEQVGAVARE